MVLERLGRVVGVHVAEERQVGRQRLQAEVGVLEREHHLLEQHPVAARRQVQPVPSQFTTQEMAKFDLSSVVSGVWSAIEH